MRAFRLFILLSCLIVVIPASSALAQCLYCDDFNDGIMPDWSYPKPAWFEPLGGNMLGVPVARKAIAIASPAFAGCTVCSVESTMQTDGGNGNRLWMLGWYKDNRNAIELMMNQETGKWVLKQRINGKVVAKTKAAAAILPGVSYDVVVSYDSVRFIVTVDGEPIIGLNPAGMVPNGTVGFQVKNTTGTFGLINVNNTTSSSLPAGAYAHLGYHNGLLVVKGWLQFDSLNPAGFTGTWHLEGVAPDPDIGPQIGDGKLTGLATSDGKVLVNLNPDTADDNVYLTGRMDTVVYKGSWVYVGFAGPIASGRFDCREE